jgi:hypothetical protein
MLGQQPRQPQQPTPEQVLEMQVMQAMGNLSMGIYSHLAVAYLTSLDVHESVDREKLRALAKERASIAAKAYFEGIGRIKIEKD